MRLSTLSATVLLAGSAAAASMQKRAPLITRDETGIDGKYIVMMKPASSAKTTARVKSAAKSVDVEPDMVFDKLGGFSATLSDKEVDNLRNDPNVRASECLSMDVTNWTSLGCVY